MTNFLDKFGFIVEHSKTEVFHFSRSHGSFNPSPLDLSLLGGLILSPKNFWKYLGFIFNRKLTFYQHVNFYSNRALSSVKCIKLLGNSSCGISPLQKYLLYRCCILPITLYSFQLWFYHHAPLSYLLKALGKMQRRAAIWILGMFKISPSEEIEAIMGLIPIKLHLLKLGGRSQLWVMSLPTNHIIQCLMDSLFSSPHNWYPSFLNSFTNRQKANIKDHLINSNNRSHGIFSSFSPTYSELSLGFWVIDIFSDKFSFNLCNKEKNDKFHFQQLNSVVIELSSSQSIAIVAMYASIKNNIATFISHMHILNQPLIKTLHHAAFVTSSEAELFTIRCSISQASSKENIFKIIIITDSIHIAKKIFDPSSHLFQR